MSLKTDYLDGANGLTEKMMEVFDAGQLFVTTNNAALISGLQGAAASGLSTFTITILTGFQPEFLRLEGTHMNTYFSGIRSGLLTEFIYTYEVAIALNTSDQTDTSVDLNFTF